MANDMKKTDKRIQADATERRREFLKKAGTFGITAPMAYLLLSVDKKALACPRAYACDT